MKSFAVLALVGAVAAMPQPSAVTAAIAPSGTIPASCSTNYAGEFEISVVNASTVAKREVIAKRTALLLTLQNGILKDSDGRTGYIASNDQFQFDNPVQSGAIYTAGWSVCSNGTLALGDSAIFYECLSGTFYNLYDESQGAQCTPIFIDVIAVSGTTASSASSVATSAGAVTQIGDGQIQAATTTAVVVSQISDGQIQAPTSTAVVVSQISDGQIQNPVTTSSVAVVSQISDGQIQATVTSAAKSSSSVAVVSQISDGQIQASATNGTRTTSATPSASTYTGAAATIGSGMFAAAAGVVAYALL